MHWSGEMEPLNRSACRVFVSFFHRPFAYPCFHPPELPWPPTMIITKIGKRKIRPHLVRRWSLAGCRLVSTNLLPLRVTICCCDYVCQTFGVSTPTPTAHRQSNSETNLWWHPSHPSPHWRRRMRKSRQNEWKIPATRQNQRLSSESCHALGHSSRWHTIRGAGIEGDRMYASFLPYSVCDRRDAFEIYYEPPTYELITISLTHLFGRNRLKPICE